MNKKVFGIVMAGALALGSAAVIPTLAATDTVQQPQLNAQKAEDTFLCDYNGRGRGGFEGAGNPRNTEYIEEQAAKYRIETDGKNPRDVMQEIRESRIIQEASELGIDVAGKDLNDLALELHEQKVLQVAKELGINSTDMSVEELTREIFTNYADEAKELGMFQGRGTGQGLGPKTDFDSTGGRGKGQCGGNGMNRWSNVD